MPDTIDIKENEIYRLSPELMRTLLIDRTLTTEAETVNIFWATDNYADRGEGYQYNDRITVEAITGENGNIIQPRAVKSREVQRKRIREKGEVFTPSWVCNEMANGVDAAKFKRKNVFNTEVHDYKTNTHTWIVTEGEIAFPEHMTWEKYVRDASMEITCGEAPFLVSRYDTVTGNPIPIKMRIGLLDRKLRIVGEHTSTREEWVEWALVAFKSIYGYEWQGDNLVLARENILFTFIEYYRDRFGCDPGADLVQTIAEIASWNIWQMDGLKGVIPNSCGPKPAKDELGGDFARLVPCPACKSGKVEDIKKHNGIRCVIMDWEEGHPIEYVSLIKR